MHKKILGILTMVLCTCFLTGCGDNELENRSFPLAVGFEKEQGECRLIFDFPNLSNTQSGNTDTSQTTVVKRSGEDFFSIQKNYEKSSSKQIDFSHTKVLILSEELLEDEYELKKLLDYTKTQELMARNTYLFVTDMPMDELFAMGKELQKPLGIYLEELLESDEDYKNKQIMTLGKLYDEQINQKKALYIPILGEQEKTPVVQNAYVLKNGKAFKKVSAKMAVNSMFLQGKLQGLDFSDAKGRKWRISNIKNKYYFEGDVKKPYLKLAISCEAVWEDGTITDWREEERIENALKTELGGYFTSEAERGLREGIDMTNSYKKLGGYFRDAYIYYEKHGGYEEALQIETEVTPTIVNSN